jgi:hypothetical protein
MTARRLGAAGSFLGAVVLVVGAVALLGTGFAGPAPVLLAGAGGLVVMAVTLWRPPRPGRRMQAYPREDRAQRRRRPDQE